MRYAEATAVLSAASAELAGTRRKFELEHMRILAAGIDDPQRRFPAVLIAGTNGKGSTAASLASVLACSGYRVGLYTSPHLLRVNERIQVGDPAVAGNFLQPLGDEAFAASLGSVHAAAEDLVRGGGLPQPPSFFELLTATAFHAFATAGVDIAVLEVGLGGRLDATNIVDPLCSVITDIALDHTEWLGDTITLIAGEKAGILRPGGTLITLPQHPEANAAIGERAMALGVTGISAAAYLPQPSPREAVADGYPLAAFGGTLQVVPRLPGEHQRRNLALALATADWLRTHAGFDRITLASVAAGVEQVRWPGRLEQARLPGGAALLLDVAHNPAGIWTLRSWLSRCFSDGSLPAPRTLVFGTLADKAMEEMARVLFPLFDSPGDRVLLVPVQSPRAAPLERLLAVAADHAGHPVHATETLGSGAAQVLPGAAAVYAGLRAQRQGSVVVAGSVYLVGEWKHAMQTDSSAAAGRDGR